jgi:dTDP-4-amino-4,6-dideoxygalactose transaminase
MKIPIMNLKTQYVSIKDEVDSAIRKVVDSQHFILGEEVESFEGEVAKYCNTQHSVGVASGTDALILSLKAFGIGLGDEVITTPFTFFATAEAVSIVGATPVFVDIDPKTYTINPRLIEAKITRNTRAIIPVHLFGQCADMDPIIEIAKKHNLKIIEDTAQAMGATYKGRQAGSMGDAGALSFFPSKNLGGFGDGGMVVTNDSVLADKIRKLRVHGSAMKYIHSVIGMNSRLDSLQASVLRVKLRHLDRWLADRRKVAQYYDEQLEDLSSIRTPFAPAYNLHTYHLYVLAVEADPKNLLEHLNSVGIEARAYYPVPLHLQECYRTLGYKKNDLSESESASSRTLAIPLFSELNQQELGYVVGNIKNFFKKGAD